VPKIPAELLESVVYLYPSLESAQEGRGFGGTGFIIDTPAYTDPLQRLLIKDKDAPRFRYVVTNKHVVDGAREQPAQIVRANTAEGNVCIATEPEEWIFGPRHDVAIRALSEPEVPFPMYGRIKFEYFVPERADFPGSMPGPGEDVFYLGRFIAHEGARSSHGQEQQNTPTVRFGNVSMLPLEPIAMQHGPPQQAYLVEARSLSGYSGSPVFVYEPEIEVEYSEYDPTLDLRAGIDMMTRIRLLGVGCGHVQTSESLNSGMMVVIPAARIIELLELDHVQESRTGAHKEWQQRDER
jgi:hypothetical protein